MTRPTHRRTIVALWLVVVLGVVLLAMETWELRSQLILTGSSIHDAWRSSSGGARRLTPDQIGVARAFSRVLSAVGLIVVLTLLALVGHGLLWLGRLFASIWSRLDELDSEIPSEIRTMDRLP